MGPGIVKIAVGVSQPLVAGALARAIGSAHGMVLAGRAARTWAALAVIIEQTAPDVVLIDPELCTGGIAELIAALAGTSAAILLFGGADHPGALSAILRAGFAGVIDRRAEAPDVIAALRAAAEGELIVSPALQSQLAKRLATPVARSLTAREADVLRLTAHGCTADQVARRLFISKATTKTHLRAIYRKLGVPNAAAAVWVACREGLLPMLDPAPQEACIGGSG